MFTALSALLATLALAGCATCERHPLTCTAVTLFAAGAIAAASQHQDSPQSATFGVKRPVCSAGAC